jgi:hypothetical protein
MAASAGLFCFATSDVASRLGEKSVCYIGFQRKVAKRRLNAEKVIGD